VTVDPKILPGKLRGVSIVIDLIITAILSYRLALKETGQQVSPGDLPRHQSPPLRRCGDARCLNLSSGRSSIASRTSPMTMSTPTTSWASSVSWHLRAAKEVLRDAILNPRYVWNCEICRVKRLKSEGTAQRPPMRLRLGKPTNLTRGWLFKCTVF
jgi:hypothetical protein